MVHSSHLPQRVRDHKPRTAPPLNPTSPPFNDLRRRPTRFIGLRCYLVNNFLPADQLGSRPFPESQGSKSIEAPRERRFKNVSINFRTPPPPALFSSLYFATPLACYRPACSNVTERNGTDSVAHGGSEIPEFAKNMLVRIETLAAKAGYTEDTEATGGSSNNTGHGGPKPLGVCSKGPKRFERLHASNAS